MLCRRSLRLIRAASSPRPRSGRDRPAWPGHRGDSRSAGAYPRLSDAQIAALAAQGQRRETRPEEVLFCEDDRDCDIGLGAGLRIPGSRYSPDARRVRDFAARNRLPCRWLDVVVQNHLLQVRAPVAMDPPVGASADDTQDKKVEVFRAMPPADPRHYVRGQYQGYADVPGVARSSTTKTFVALRLEIDNRRWADVPNLRTGRQGAAGSCHRGAATPACEITEVSELRAA